jgi:hypothetical protein
MKLRAFSEEVDTGSSKENAVNHQLRAVDLIQSDCNRSRACCEKVESGFSQKSMR